MYSEKEQLNLKMIIALSRSLQTINKKQAKIINEHSLTISQFGVLEVLYHKGPLCINSIIEKTLSTSGNMTVVIENLRKDNYIVKEKDTNDQRKYIISLTKKGKSIIDKIFPEHLKNIDKILEKFTDKEKKELLLLLEKFR